MAQPAFAQLPEQSSSAQWNHGTGDCRQAGNLSIHFAAFHHSQLPRQSLLERQVQSPSLDALKIGTTKPQNKTSD